MQHVEAMVRGTEPVQKAAKVEDASIQAAAAELEGTELFSPENNKDVRICCLIVARIAWCERMESLLLH